MCASVYVCACVRADVCACVCNCAALSLPLFAVAVGDSDASPLVKEHRAVYAGRVLPSNAVVGVLGLDAESCIHIVHKPSQRTLALESASPCRTSVCVYDSGSVSGSRGDDGDEFGGVDGPAVPLFAGAGADVGAMSREWSSAVDRTLMPFKQAGVPPDVLFDNDGATAETSGKWVTVMADSPGVSSGRLEWELKVTPLRKREGRVCV